MSAERAKRWQKRAAIVQKIAGILRLDRSTKALNVEELAERLYCEGLRVRLQEAPAKKERT